MVKAVSTKDPKATSANSANAATPIAGVIGERRPLHVSAHFSPFLAKLQFWHWFIPTMLILVLSAWVIIERTYSIRGFTLDDSFITYRYAKHFVEGDGLVWNIGENPRVEGYTTFLWVMINALFELVNLDPEWGSKILSTLAFILIAPMMAITPAVAIRGFQGFKTEKAQGVFGDAAQVLPHPWGWALTSVFIVAVLWVSPDTPPHIVSGMETVVAALILLGFALFLAYFDGLHRLYPRQAWLGLGFLALAGGLIRPEFNLGIGIGLFSALAIGKIGKGEPQVLRALLRALALYFVLGLIYYLWRYHYYGLPFPLPFYIKQLQPSSELLKGYAQMKLFFETYQLFIVLAIVGALLSPKRLIPPLLTAAAILGYFFFPDHIMGIYMRFPFPLLPIILWLALHALQRALSLSFVPSPLWTFGLLFFVLALITGKPSQAEILQKGHPQYWQYLPLYDTQWRRNKAWLDDYNHAEHRSLMPLGRAIAWARENANGEPPIKVAMVDLGAAAYYGNWPMLDLFGLTHPKLALARARGEYNADMLLAEAPDIVLLGEFYKEDQYRGQFPFESELYNRMPSFGYIPAGRFIWNRVFGFLVFAKNPQVKERFNRALQQSPEISATLQVFPDGVGIVPYHQGLTLP